MLKAGVRQTWRACFRGRASAPCPYYEFCAFQPVRMPSIPQYPQTTGLRRQSQENVRIHRERQQPPLARQKSRLWRNNRELPRIHRARKLIRLNQQLSSLWLRSWMPLGVYQAAPVRSPIPPAKGLLGPCLEAIWKCSAKTTSTSIRSAPQSLQRFGMHLARQGRILMPVIPRLSSVVDQSLGVRQIRNSNHTALWCECRWRTSNIRRSKRFLLKSRTIRTKTQLGYQDYLVIVPLLMRIPTGEKN